MMYLVAFGIPAAFSLGGWLMWRSFDRWCDDRAAEQRWQNTMRVTWPFDWAEETRDEIRALPETSA